MKVRNKQLYSNECGLCAIKNLLYFNNIKDNNVDLDFQKEGCSINQMMTTLKRYFFEVEAVSFDLLQLRDIKKFSPFIILLKKEGISHFVVVYKKNKKFLYIMDSLYTKTYKVTYEEIDKIECVCSIVVSHKKEMKLSNKMIKNTIYNVLLSFVESLFLLSNTILIQQIIDNGYNDAFIYMLVQVFLILVTTCKIRNFLKTFRWLDNDLVKHTMYSIYKLDDKYIHNHNIDEIYYRINDAYYYKSVLMTFLYDLISDIVLFVLTIILMFIYSFSLSIIFLTFSLILIFIVIKIFNKSKRLFDKRRESEYEFINHYRDSFKDLEITYNGKDKQLKQSIELLEKYQNLDFKFEKLHISKDLILVYFQSVIISLIVIIYFTNLYQFISIGSLVALINLVTLVLHPLLNICSKIPSLSYYSIALKRVKDVIKNVK